MLAHRRCGSCVVWARWVCPGSAPGASGQGPAPLPRISRKACSACSPRPYSAPAGTDKKSGEKKLRKIGYHASVQRLGVSHRFLPPATPNAHRDVESSHTWIENEFFDLERFTSRGDFFEKVSTYQLWWNFARPSYSKDTRTPAEILQEGIDPQVLLLTPTDLDAMFRKTHNTCQVGQHLPVDAVFIVVAINNFQLPEASKASKNGHYSRKRNRKKLLANAIIKSPPKGDIPVASSGAPLPPRSAAK